MDVAQQLWNPAIGGFAVALGVGLLVGLERERSKGTGPQRRAAGIRSFAIAALLGALAAFSGSTLLIALFGAAIGGLAIAAYLRSAATDPGLTTELALVATYAIGALAIEHPRIAAGCGALLAVLLASRSALHAFVTRTLSDREVLDAILLAASALIVLPLLPDRAIDPYGAVNPRLVGELTIAVLLLNALGYVALRGFGPGRGLALAGLFGGFVSSAATIAAMGQRARAEPQLTRATVAGAGLSSVATVLQLAVVLGLVDLPTLQRLTGSLVLMGLVAASYGLLMFHRALIDEARAAASAVPAGRAFQPRQALMFAALISVLSFIAALLADRLGRAGAIAGIGLAGFGDAHAAAASAAALARGAALEPASVGVAIGAALTANAITKLIAAYTAGGPRYTLALAPGIVGMTLAFWAGLSPVPMPFAPVD